MPEVRCGITERGIEVSDVSIGDKRSPFGEFAVVVQCFRANLNCCLTMAEPLPVELLPDLPKDLEAEVEPYFVDAVDAKLYPDDGGSVEAVNSDFEFYTVSGALTGDKASLKAEDFWTLGPLEAARAKVGG